MTLRACHLMCKERLVSSAHPCAKQKARLTTQLQMREGVPMRTRPSCAARVDARLRPPSAADAQRDPAVASAGRTALRRTIPHMSGQEDQAKARPSLLVAHMLHSGRATSTSGGGRAARLRSGPFCQVKTVPPLHRTALPLTSVYLRPTAVAGGDTTHT